MELQTGAGPMSLFNRKRRDEDDDHVRLASSDHSWWTGEEPVGPDPEEDFDAAPFSLGPVDDGDDAVVDLDELRGPDEAATAGDEMMTGIAQALTDYAYGGAPVQDDDAWPMAERLDDSELDTVEQTLFVRDGLPAEDRLTELLGTLGLEGDSDWVDIARAHRRLVTTSASGRPEWEQDRQRRAANEAYACLRLFHH